MTDQTAHRIVNHPKAKPEGIPKQDNMSTKYSSDSVYIPVELGTIRIGQTRVTERGTSPQKLDHFLVTNLVRSKYIWGEHELMTSLRAQQHQRDAEAAQRRAQAHETPPEQTKVRSIPIRLMFDDPQLAMNARFEAFDRDLGRPVCASLGDGQAVRCTGGQSERVECKGPDECSFAQEKSSRSCKFFGRLSVQIEGQRQSDNCFVLRTTSWNTIRTVEAKLRRYHALFKGRLAGVPFRLHLRARSTPGSKWSTFYFLDIDLDGVSFEEAAKLAGQLAQDRANSPFIDWSAMESEAKAGLLNGRLNHDPVEADLMEQFFLPNSTPEQQQEEQRTFEREPVQSSSNQPGQRVVNSTLVHLPSFTPT